MIFTIVLWIIGLIVLYRFLVMIFWTCAWLACQVLLLALQPVRFALYVCGAIFAPRAASPPVAANVIQFPRIRR